MKLKIPIILAVLLLAGCPGEVHQPRSGSLDSAGGAVERVIAHNESAESLVTEAKKDSGRVGKSLLTQASGEHTAVDRAAADAKTQIANAVEERAKALKERDDAIKATKTIYNSKQYKIGWVVWTAKDVIAILCAIHLICGFLSMILPSPYKEIASVIAKIVNPFGWLVWLLGHLEIKKATATTTTEAQ